MKILMVTPYVPYPPSSGGQIRTFNLLKHLSKNNEITLVSLFKDETEKQYESYLKNYCKKIYLCQRPEKPWTLKTIINTLFSFQPFLVVRNFSEEAKEIIDNLLKKESFDVIHAETFYVMPHIPKTLTPIVLVEQTIEYNVYKHFVNSLSFFLRLLVYFDIDIFKLKYWERYYWKKADIVVAVSSPDEKTIKKEVKKIKTSIIPNCVGDEIIVNKLEKKDLKKPIIFFQGNFYWLQNVEAAKFLIEKIYPILKKTDLHFSLIIAGQNAKKIGTVKEKSIRLIDIVSNDTQTVKNLFQQASLFIAPIFGPGGTRLKILAAMGSGIPVISTRTGVEGLAVKNNLHILIAETPREFINKIKEILSKKTLYKKIRQNAYFLVKEKYQWSEIANKLENLYRNL